MQVMMKFPQKQLPDSASGNFMNNIKFFINTHNKIYVAKFGWENSH
ncbi:hypothetical protein NSP_31940 [Nodularia spumigena CCY9414]|nr:hypothetical protein NSP_31940 [Nodularia spumigena CCY9414]